MGAVAGLLPIGDGFDLTGWVVLDTETVGMAVIGIAVALALVRPWGRRIRGPLVAFVAWVGTGLLVPLLPYVVRDSLLACRTARRSVTKTPVLPRRVGKPR